jgi:hypothetical protein
MHPTLYVHEETAAGNLQLKTVALVGKSTTLALSCESLDLVAKAFIPEDQPDVDGSPFIRAKAIRDILAYAENKRPKNKRQGPMAVDNNPAAIGRATAFF